jgi:hypothetical protein
MVQARGRRLPPGGIAGEDERGRPDWCRRRRHGWGERSRLAVPGQTLRRDVETAPPASSGRGRLPPPPWQRVAAWRAARAEGAWQRLDVRAGAQGPLVVEVVTRRVVPRTPRRHQGDAAL